MNIYQIALLVSLYVGNFLLIKSTSEHYDSGVNTFLAVTFTCATLIGFIIGVINLFIFLGTL